MPASPLPETALVFCVFLTLLVPLAAAGLALINAGLGRSRSAAHSIMAALCVIAVAAIVYFICGFAWQGFIGRPAHIMMAGGKPWDWIAAEPFFFRGLQLDGSAASPPAWRQMLCVGLPALSPLGRGAARWRGDAVCISSRSLIYRRGTWPRRADCRQQYTLCGFCNPHNSGDYTRAFRQTGRLSQRQWMGERFGGQQRRLRFHLSRGCGHDWSGRGRAGYILSRTL